MRRMTVYVQRKRNGRTVWVETTWVADPRPHDGTDGYAESFPTTRWAEEQGEQNSWFRSDASDLVSACRAASRYGGAPQFRSIPAIRRHVAQIERDWEEAPRLLRLDGTLHILLPNAAVVQAANEDSGSVGRAQRE